MSDRQILSCSVATGDAAIGAFDTEWDELARNSPHATAFQSAAWYRAWAAAVAEAEAKAPIVVSIRSGCRLVAGLALQCGGKNGEKTIGFLSSPWADYHDAIGCLDEPAVAAAALEAVAALAADLGATVDLSDLVNGGCLDKALPESVRRFLGTEVFSVDLENREHLQKVHSAKEYLAKTRRLDRLGTVSCSHYSETQEIEFRFGHLVALHRTQWSGRTDAIAPFDSHVERGFRAMIREMAPAGAVIYTEFTLHQQVIASYFGFRWGNWYGAYRTAFDSSFMRYSPGHLMLRRMFEDFRRDGIRRFDLGRGAHDYKMQYATEAGCNLRASCRGQELLAC